MKNQISKNFHLFFVFFYLFQMSIGKFINNLLGYQDAGHNYFYIWEYTWFRIFVFAVPIILVLIYRLFLHENECHSFYLFKIFPSLKALDFIQILLVNIQKSKHFLLCMDHEEGIGSTATWALQV